MKLVLSSAITALGLAIGTLASADGDILTSLSGMTVYTFDKDVPASGKSACAGSCALTWQPVLPSAMPRGLDFSTILRENGVRQAAYQDRPLYFYSGDRKPGDKSGDNVDGAWHAVSTIGSIEPVREHRAGWYGYKSGYSY